MIEHETIQQGYVTKVVRVPPAPHVRGGSHTHDFGGYGILRSRNGKDVFFVGAALSQDDFAKLETGVTVHYTMEPGPLLRAAKVWIESVCEPNSDCVTATDRESASK